MNDSIEKAKKEFLGAQKDIYKLVKKGGDAKELALMGIHGALASISFELTVIRQHFLPQPPAKTTTDECEHDWKFTKTSKGKQKSCDKCGSWMRHPFSIEKSDLSN